MKQSIQAFGNAQVQLRLLAETDLGLTRTWRNREDVRVWFKNSSLISAEQHRAWYLRYATRDDDLVFVVEADGRPVGQASVYNINRAEGTAEIGRFVVAPEAKGRGFIGLACSELLRFCGEALNLRHVFLEVKEGNARAIKIYERNGFCEEARSEGLIRMSRSLNRNLAGGAAYAGNGTADIR
jgi:diamine N-acetyltransferase